MARLTDRTARTAGTGKHGDGSGLQLVVSKAGRRTWVLRYQLNGVRHDMGLGSYPAVGLSDARISAADARKLIAQKIDPLNAREASRKAERPVPKFGDIAKLVVADAQSKTANPKVAYQWARHLGPAYSGPLLDRPVNEITTMDVAAVLRPVWRSKPEVARKLYSAIRRVFEHARIILRDQHGIAMADNPARWDDLKAMGFEAPAALSRELEFGRAQSGGPDSDLGRRGGSPRPERFLSEDAERAAGRQMALDVESVLDRGMNG